MNVKALGARVTVFQLQIVACLVLALMIRLPAWGELPAGLNRDEAALGYNAFALLTNGTDEHGVVWPATFRSFGDEKLPGYIYTLIPFIKMFGLTIEAVKLPSLLAGLALIPLLGVIARELSHELPKSWRTWLPGITMLLVAASPWGNHFSRIAYEAHLAMAFFVGGLVAFLVARHSTSQRWLLILSASCFSAAFATYHSYQLFLPFFLLALAWIFRSELPKYDRKGVGVGLGIGVLTAVVLLLGGVWSANLTKQAGISPFSQTAVARSIGKWRAVAPGVPGKLLSNRWIEPGVTFSGNYLRSFSPEFFFLSGSENHVHNVSGIGNLHPVLAPLILIGFFWAFRSANKPVHQVLLVWFFLALVPGSLTILPTHTIRAAASFPALELLAALGITALIVLSRWRTATIATLGVLFLFSVARLEVQYLRIAPPLDQAHAHDRYHLLARALEKYRQNSDAVITQSPSSSPAIWYLFETRFPVTELLQQRENYPVDAEQFIHTKRIGNVFFETLQWPEVEDRARRERLTLILRPAEFPLEKRLDSSYRFVESLTSRTGTVEYEVWQTGFPTL